MKGSRVSSLIFRLGWVIHLFACGWYMCAALAEDPENTWAYRRKVDGKQEVPLLDRPPLDQWMNCMYFVLTVFTTVGFGDISACSMGEICYVFCTVVIGAIIHSMIVSEVITVITARDQVKEFMLQQIRLVESFGDHAQVSEDAVQHMKSWIRLSVRHQARTKSAAAEMKEFVTGPDMPRSIISQLPQALFGGRLVRNTIFGDARRAAKAPPRLSVLMALACQQQVCQAGQIVYEVTDYPFNLCLVLFGTFAYVALPSPRGGRRPAMKMTHTTTFGAVSTDPMLFAFQLFSARSYFGDAELFLKRGRHTTARAEAEGSVVLLLHVNEILNIMDEFPEYGKKWKFAALDRALVSKRRQAKLTCAYHYQDLAAFTIQRFWLGRQDHLPKPGFRLATALGLAREVLEDAMTSPSMTHHGQRRPYSRRENGDRTEQLVARMDHLQETTAAQVSKLCARMEALHEVAAAQVKELRLEVLALRSTIVGV